MAEVFKKLFENPDLRTQLGQNGRATVTQQFAPDTMVDNIEKVYQGMMSCRA